MTRIVGIARCGSEGRVNGDLENMLRASQPSSCRMTHRCTISSLEIGIADPNDNRLLRIGDVVVAIDGQVFNRAELGQFETDAEAVVKLYKRHGFSEALGMLNGDFAIGLYDALEDTLWLGRDRFGVKPLYYFRSDQQFAFASRLSALISLPGVTRDVNRRYVGLFAGSHYRYFDNKPDATPFADIQQLPAAHTLRFKQGIVSNGPYWKLHQQSDWDVSEEELSEQYRELLLDAVSIRLRATKRPAFTLSGGMDSSSVLASAVHVTQSKQHAFSTVYSDKTYDEADDIKSMLETTVEEWHQVPIGTPDVFSLIEQMVRLHDEPVATATWLSHYLLCEKAADAGFDCLFGGLGGDELNAGEFEHFLYFFADLRIRGKDERLGQEIEKWIQYHDHPVFRKSPELVERQFSQLVDLKSPGKCVADRERLLRYGSAICPDYFDLSGFQPQMDHPFDSYLKNRTYQDLMRETIPCCLRAEDRQSVAFGLDCFLPFFDHRLVEFMFRVPTDVKYRDGVTKSLLRQAMRGVLPEETRTRIAKTGWNAPAHVWFSGRGLDEVCDLVRSQRFRERGIYNVDEVERIVDEHRHIMEHQELKENHMMFIWQLVNLEIWLHTCVDAAS